MTTKSEILRRLRPSEETAPDLLSESNFYVQKARERRIWDDTKLKRIQTLSLDLQLSRSLAPTRAKLSLVLIGVQPWLFLMSSYSLISWDELTNRVQLPISQNP